MDRGQALQLLRGALSDITVEGGLAATDRFNSLREVDAKHREVRMTLESSDGLPPSLLASMSADPDFQANSRRVRLEALAGYIRSAIKFLDTGAFEKPKKLIYAPPDLTRLTQPLPGLREELERRWREAQRCVHAEAYTAAVIMMGSILEGLLLARCQLAISIAQQSSRAPKDRDGKHVAVHDWKLSALIDVAVDVGWLKSDRGKFSHALRESRNVVHPWQAVMQQTNFDEATCKTSWSVLDASVDDLLKSIVS
jgi:hypothetical protein